MFIADATLPLPVFAFRFPAYPNARTRPRADTAAPASFRTRGSVLGRAHTERSGPKSRFAGGRAGEPRRGGPDAIRRPGVPAGRREPEDPRAARRTADGGSPGSAPAAKRVFDDINSACPRALAPTRHASTPLARRPGPVSLARHPGRSFASQRSRDGRASETSSPWDAAAPAERTPPLRASSLFRRARPRMRCPRRPLTLSLTRRSLPQTHPIPRALSQWRPR
jgi:hypothetical protein